MSESATRTTELDSGVRVVTEAVPSVRSVALGLWVRTGSRDESIEQAGVSHFLEHLLFKGTKRYTAIELNERFDSLGAAFNAATSKETTHIHARFLDEHTEEVFDLMSEMMLHSTLPEAEVDSERQVVIEEIAMYEDEPQDKVHDVLDEALFGDHPLGRRIIGSAEVIGGIPVPDIAAYHAERYTGPNLVVAAAGNLEHDAIHALAEKLVSAAPGEADHALPAPSERPKGVAFQMKDTEQYHLCLGAPGLSRSDERRYTLRVLNTLLGGASSSRLFKEVREKRGLAYSVGSYVAAYRETGMIGLYVGTREDRVSEAMQVVGDELARLSSEPVAAEELRRVKETVKGRLVLAQESTGARMSALAGATLFDLPILTLDEMIERVESVTSQEITDLAAELMSPERFSAAAIGKEEGVFRSALGAVSEELSAA
ncbi:MAG: M16 family metallopeptidase [bacterium]